MGRQLMGRNWSPRRVKTSQPASSIGLSKHQPARLVMRGLDDTVGQKDSLVEERLDP